MSVQDSTNGVDLQSQVPLRDNSPFVLPHILIGKADCSRLEISICIVAGFRKFLPDTMLGLLKVDAHASILGLPLGARALRHLE